MSIFDTCPQVTGPIHLEAVMQRQCPWSSRSLRQIDNYKAYRTSTDYPAFWDFIQILAEMILNGIFNMKLTGRFVDSGFSILGY